MAIGWNFQCSKREGIGKSIYFTFISSWEKKTWNEHDQDDDNDNDVDVDDDGDGDGGGGGGGDEEDRFNEKNINF